MPCGHIKKYSNILREPAAPTFRIKEEAGRFLLTVNFYQTVWYHNPERSIQYRITRFKCRAVIAHWTLYF